MSETPSDGLQDQERTPHPEYPAEGATPGQREEQDTRVFLGKDITVLRDRRGGTTKPLTLREFRERVQADAIEVDPDDLGGCACYTPEEGL